MAKLMFRLPWGRVYSTRFADNIFKGDPTKYATALIESYNGNKADALLQLDRTVTAQNIPFFIQVRNVILNRIAGKTRKDRAARLAAAAPAPAPAQ